MTEQEILTRQEQSGNREFFLILIGRVYHAYGCGAFALARLTGYQVRRVLRKQGEVLMLGFPIDRFDVVLDRVREAGGDWESVDGKVWRFFGVDGTPDMQMVSEPKNAPKPATSPAPCRGGDRGGGAADDWLADAVRNFDLSASTPMQAMLFISELKQRLQRLSGSAGCPWDRDSEIACESSPG